MNVLRRCAAAAAAATIVVTGSGTGTAGADTSARGQTASAERTAAGVPKKTKLPRAVRRAPSAGDPQGDITPEEARRYFHWSQHINKS